MQIQPLTLRGDGGPERSLLFRPQNYGPGSLVHLSSVFSNVGTVLPTTEISSPQVSKMPFKYLHVSSLWFTSTFHFSDFGVTYKLRAFLESSRSFLPPPPERWHCKQGREAQVRGRKVCNECPESPCSHEHTPMSWLPHSQNALMSAQSCQVSNIGHRMTQGRGWKLWALGSGLLYEMTYKLSQKKKKKNFRTKRYSANYLVSWAALERKVLFLNYFFLRLPSGFLSLS